MLLFKVNLNTIFLGRLSYQVVTMKHLTSTQCTFFTTADSCFFLNQCKGKTDHRLYFVTSLIERMVLYQSIEYATYWIPVGHASVLQDPAGCIVIGSVAFYVGSILRGLRWYLHMLQSLYTTQLYMKQIIFIVTLLAWIQTRSILNRRSVEILKSVRTSARINLELIRTSAWILIFINPSE